MGSTGQLRTVIRVGVWPGLGLWAGVPAERSLWIKQGAADVSGGNSWPTCRA